MSQATNSIRNMMDAHLDISNGIFEYTDNSTVTGWTTQIVQYFSDPNIGNSSIAFTEYLNVRDANGDYPESTGVDVDLSNNTATVNNFPVNVGLRHYHQQCQAMKGTNNNFTPSTNTSMGGDNPNTPITPPSQTNILQVSDGSGVYKTSNIRMRGFRGFQYHQNFNGIWNASTGQGATTEHIPVGFSKVQIGTQQ
jgi:hypothetical protein